MTNDRKKFTIRARAQSFVYAYRGVMHCLKTQHNAWIHLFISFWVIFFGFFFNISALEWAVLVLAMGLVLAAETFNTAIEEFVDWLSPQLHPKAGLVKDIASGAVLLAAISASLVGLLIFLPKMWIFLAQN
ncbi:MAG: diacylglycerol kinase family protein [Microscillaceae bacterium]|nr:diacylglycerol kinase family protein [Microscillaceae bacterium]